MVTLYYASKSCPDLICNIGLVDVICVSPRTSMVIILVSENTCTCRCYWVGPLYYELERVPEVIGTSGIYATLWCDCDLVIFLSQEGRQREK